MDQLKQLQHLSLVNKVTTGVSGQYFTNRCVSDLSSRVSLGENACNLGRWWFAKLLH